jgi:hypothetical protein
MQISSGYRLPPRIWAKLPRKLKTRRNRSGRVQATVNAQLPPLLPPPIAHHPHGAFPATLAAAGL